MKVRLSELDCAARDALAVLDMSCLPTVAQLISSTAEEDPELSFAEAGLALLAALVIATTNAHLTPDQGVTLARGLDLASLRVDDVDGGEPLYLPPEAVMAHPLFGQWVGLTLADAFAHMLKAGTIRTQMAPGSPVFETMHITDYGLTLMGARHRLIWPTVRGDSFAVVASYGAAGNDSAVCRTLAVAGQTIVEVGVRTPLVEQRARADEVALASAFKSAAEAAGAALH